MPRGQAVMGHLGEAPVRGGRERRAARSPTQGHSTPRVQQPGGLVRGGRVGLGALGGRATAMAALFTPRWRQRTARSRALRMM
jgi:hypothetical protein